MLYFLKINEEQDFDSLYRIDLEVDYGKQTQQAA